MKAYPRARLPASLPDKIGTFQAVKGRIAIEVSFTLTASISKKLCD